jgi:hypothetical protein
MPPASSRSPDDENGRAGAAARPPSGTASGAAGDAPAAELTRFLREREQNGGGEDAAREQ